MKQWITYRGKGFKVDVPYKIRKGRCKCCGKKCWTNLHHWAYKYKVKEIRKNHLLALENTTELCLPCHDVANSLNLLSKTDKRIINKLFKLKYETLS